MSTSLKTMMDDQAASVAFKAPDLDAIVRTGGRRIRRRRAATVLGAIAVAAALTGTAITVFAPGGRQPTNPVVEAAAPVPTDTASWALGSTIYHGDQSVEVGYEVRSYVRTSAGFVTLDGDGEVYSVTSRGTTPIGHALPVSERGTDRRRLLSDPRGTLAGWLSGNSYEPVLQVHDQATGQTRAYEAAAGAVFFAIDGRTAYWRTASTADVVAVDLDTGDQRQVAGAGLAPRMDIWSVENGVLAFSLDHQAGGNVTSIQVGRSAGDAGEFTFGENTEADDQPLLSPTGAWLSYLLYEFNGPPVQDDVRAFTGQVRDTSTGELVPLSLPASTVAFPVGWLDDATVQLLVLAREQAGMYACVLPAGTCEPAAALHTAEIDGNNLVLPGGSWTGP